jgi:hypothetical protein
MNETHQPLALLPGTAASVGVARRETEIVDGHDPVENLNWVAVPAS